MEKFIILAGSPNVGKTCTIHKVLLSLLELGYVPPKEFEDGSKEKFWLNVDSKGNPNTSGEVVLKKGDKKVVVITYGDTVDSLKLVFNNINFDLVTEIANNPDVKHKYQYLKKCSQNNSTIQGEQKITCKAIGTMPEEFKRYLV